MPDQAPTITHIDTFRPAFQPNLCVLRLRTSDGLEGLGETFFHAEAVESYVHSSAARTLIGMDAPTPERVSAALAPYVGYQGGGVETRARGAIDIAMWDLLGKRSGLRVADLLGGPIRESVRIYNTCAGSGYVSDSSRQESRNWGVAGDGHLEDLWAFLNEPARLARELVAEGITGMKVWPFDTAAERTMGNEISRGELLKGVRIVNEIRDAVGDDIDVMVELHGMWNLTPAIQIAAALEDARPYWIEDPIRPDAVGALADLRTRTGIPLAIGETVVGRRAFLDLLSRNAMDVATVDVQWTGGITEARKVATVADAHGISVAPHDCTGPITLAAAAHLTMSQPNGLLQETVRAFLRSWYPLVVEELPSIVDGQMSLGPGPGLGVRLRDDFMTRADVVHRVSTQLEE